jgi:hypothetical protein
VHGSTRASHAAGLGNQVIVEAGVSYVSYTSPSSRALYQRKPLTSFLGHGYQNKPRCAMLRNSSHSTSIREEQ